MNVLSLFAGIGGAAVAHLHATGSNQRETAKLLGLHERTVARIVHGETTVPQSRPGRVA